MVKITNEQLDITSDKIKDIDITSKDATNDIISVCETLGVSSTIKTVEEFDAFVNSDFPLVLKF